MYGSQWRLLCAFWHLRGGQSGYIKLPTLAVGHAINAEKTAINDRGDYAYRGAINDKRLRRRRSHQRQKILRGRRSHRLTEQTLSYHQRCSMDYAEDTARCNINNEDYNTINDQEHSDPMQN